MTKRTWDDESSPVELEKAIDEGRFRDAEEIVHALIDDLQTTCRLMPTTPATRVLAVLRARAWFDHLHEVASYLADCGQRAVEVRCQLAQAAIQQGALTTAIEDLTQLLPQVENELANDPSAERVPILENELGEILGLLGRSYKQLYVDARPTPAAPRQHDLERALEYYGRAFDKKLGDFLWHGVNFIALSTHAKRVRTGDPKAYSDAAGKRAEKINAILDARQIDGPLAPWDLANRVECRLALGDTPRAVEAVKAYLEAPGLNPFKIESTRRQLEQLWSLREDAPPGDHILPMMTARLAELGGVGHKIELAPADASKYEKVWGATSYQPLEWLTVALERARCVARLGPDKYEGWGTGFLFDGAWIGDAYADRHLLLTNAHVVSDDPEVQAQFPHPTGPEENTAVFLGAGREDAAELEVLRLLWTSPPSELDASLLEIEAPPEGAAPPPLAKKLPSTEGRDSRINAIGHPRGFSVRVSMQDNEVVRVGDPYLHYRTPTDPGSSGSPLFNQKWQLVALHHASSRELSANEGVRIDRLIEAMRRDLL